jgi:hypothetical protein
MSEAQLPKFLVLEGPVQLMGRDQAPRFIAWAKGPDGTEGILIYKDGPVEGFFLNADEVVTALEFMWQVSYDLLPYMRPELSKEHGAAVALLRTLWEQQQAAVYSPDESEPEDGAR